MKSLRLRGIVWTEHRKLIAVRLLALLAVLIGFITVHASPEAVWTAFVISLYPIAIAVLFPRISDAALAIPPWGFWGLAGTLLMMGHPDDFPPPYIASRAPAFMASLTAFTAASLVIALEIQLSRSGQPYRSARAIQLAAPAWVMALSPFGIALVLFLMEALQKK